MDARALKTIEVMKSCYDFDSIVTKGSLAVFGRVIASRRSMPSMLRCRATRGGSHSDPSRYALHPFIWLLLVNYVGCRMSLQKVPVGTTVRVADEPTPKRSAVESMPRAEDLARLEKQVKMSSG
ncbi:hypothetical protein BHE74_00017624 [Ensete ventricosum]|nr:hypothetical protein BHE74_00017624 [Ensete ventricosum]